MSRNASTTNLARSFLLWIDGVGVWQILMGDRFSIGSPSGKAEEADLAIQANVVRQHAEMIATRDDWMLSPWADTYVTDQKIAESVFLQSGDQIRLGDTVKLGFQLPSPLSQSAVLHFESNHRPLQNVDGVILLTDHCIVGPQQDQHVFCPAWQDSFVLFRRGDSLLCRSSSEFRIDDLKVDEVCEIASHATLESEHCRFRIEVIR